MRGQGHFPDSGAYGASQMQQYIPSQRVDIKSPYQEDLEAFTPERDQQYAPPKADGPWRWEREGLKMPNTGPSPMFNQGQGVDASRSYFQGQRDQKVGLDKQSSEQRSQPHEENMDVGYEDSRLSQTFESLEKKFLDDVMKLAQEQNDAEDTESTRHSEKINAINAQHQGHLAALRARHATRREEYLHKESNARQQQYKQTVTTRYPNNTTRTGETMHHQPANPHGYNSGATASAAVVGGDAPPPRSYNNMEQQQYREQQTQYLGGGGPRDHGFESREQYRGGRGYDAGSRYY